MSLTLEEAIKTSYRQLEYEEAVLDPLMLTPDTAQPRKKYDMAWLENLKAATKDGLLSRIVVEEMDYTRYVDYLNGHFKDTELRSRYLERAGARKEKKQYLIVIGHLRWLSTMANGYPTVPVKIVRNVTLDERRDIQVQEDSQLPWKRWAKAMAVSRYYRRRVQELAAEGLEYTIDELSMDMGISEKNAKEMLRYDLNLDPGIKAMVEKGDLDYKRGVEIARITTADEQLRLAVGDAQRLSVKDLSKKITQMLTPENDVELLQKNASKNNRKERYFFVSRFCDTFSAFRDDLFRFYKLAEHKPEYLEEMVRLSALQEFLPQLENTLSVIATGIERGRNSKYLLSLRRTKSGKDRSDMVRMKRVIEICERQNSANKMESMPVISGKKIYVPFSKVIFDEENPRGELEEAGQEELGNSIKTRGCINEVVAEKIKKGGKTAYKIIDGHRRVDSAEKKGLKGLEMIVLEEVPPQLRLRLQIISDSQKRFTPEEAAEAWTNLYHIISDKVGRRLSAAEFGRAYNRTESSVRSALLYETLHDDVREMIMEGLLNFSTGLEISTLPEPEQYEIALQLIQSPMSYKKTRKELKHLRSTARSIELTERLKRGEEVAEDFQTTFIDRGSDTDIMREAYRKAGERLREELQFGILQLTKEMNCSKPILTDALFSDESLIRAYYHLYKTFNVLKEFLIHKNIIPQAL